MRGACPLAIHDLVEVIGIADVSEFHRLLMRAPERLTIGPACRISGALRYVQLPRSGMFPPNPRQTLISRIPNCHRHGARIRRKYQENWGKTLPLR
jgi:hypothetical protein